ncbi:uncharacterized protein B0P05DRAFT_491808 [Gilbertella persicaria]|uniref:uncharacterized protein n=1 Tax=Gilbertella persicaria TaxID=101096 RepID=UPI00221E8579|nr:uncharacterized protein B0P05DRAFT_491808 [Gilbertella persicaria]KAI8077892.1 hypothetical protein B0P05DRAFT_491808 [Gilbertella persicaria]
MPPKKKAKVLQDKKKIPEDAQWCLDRSDRLSFRDYIEQWGCLDRNQAQQRFGSIITEYFKSKSNRDKKIRDDYKRWTLSADYIQFWSTRSDSNILLKTGLGSSEIINIAIEQRLKSLKANAASSEALAVNSSSPVVSSNSFPPDVSGDSSAPEVPGDSSSPNESTSLSSTMLPEMKNYLISIMIDFVNEADTDDNPWIFEDINISHLFRKYQATVSEILMKHKTLPLESYVHELASLTHIFFLCKDQHSEIAEKVFSLDTLQQLTDFFERKTINHDLDFPSNHFVAISKTLTDLSLANKTRQQTIMEFTVLASQMSYGQNRLLSGIINLIQKLPKKPLSNYKEVSETELWNTYFDPLLSCLISDPDRLIHLRWTNVIPMEKGKSRPDAVISEKLQLSFGSSVGYGEAKAQQGSCTKLLCLDTLRLAIFTKNAIDINKLDGALAFQIHGFNITFYLQQLTIKGIYTFTEIAHLRFPQSLDDLPSLFSMINIKKLLGINDVFWSLCKKSKQPDIIEKRYKKTLVNLDDMIDATQDSTRRCVLRFGQ